MLLPEKWEMGTQSMTCWATVRILARQILGESAQLGLSWLAGRSLVAEQNAFFWLLGLKSKWSRR